MQLIGDGDVDRLAIAQRLLQVRQHLGLSHADVADSIGIAADDVARIETGDRSVDCLELRRLAILYACPVTYLLGMDSPSTGATSALTRVLGELSTEDHEQILQFAQRLRHRRAGAPPLRLVRSGEVTPTHVHDAGWNHTPQPRTRRID